MLVRYCRKNKDKRNRAKSYRGVKLGRLDRQHHGDYRVYGIFVISGDLYLPSQFTLLKEHKTHKNSCGGIGTMSLPRVMDTT
jgi:hypothetical protein